MCASRVVELHSANDTARLLCAYLTPKGHLSYVRQCMPAGFVTAEVCADPRRTQLAFRPITGFAARRSAVSGTQGCWPLIALHSLCCEPSLPKVPKCCVSRLNNLHCCSEPEERTPYFQTSCPVILRRCSDQESLGTAP